MAIPTLTTPRLVLRGHHKDDLTDLHATWTDPAVYRHVTGRASTLEETWGRLLRYAGHWAVAGWGYWAVEERASGRFAGDVGFADFHRDMTPSLGGAPEAGWVLASWAHGKGYATEALAAATRWLEGRLGPVRTVCMIAPENTASLRVAVKGGYLEWGRAEYKGMPSILFERSVEAPAARREG